MKISSRILLPLVALFLFIGSLIFVLSGYLSAAGIDTNVLHIANIIILVLNLAVFLLQKKALSHQNPNVFIRSIMGGMMAKMMISAVVVLIYVMSVGEGYNKKAVFISLFLYLIYLAVEVATLMRLNTKRDA